MEEDVDLDFKTMHAQLMKEEITYQRRLYLTIISFQTIEFVLYKIAKAHAQKIASPKIVKWLEQYIPIMQVARYLRFAGLINENGYTGIQVLANIRNDIAHELFPSNQIFKDLSNVVLKSDYVNNLPNDVLKYSLICSEYSISFFILLGNIDETTIMHLELDDESGFEEVKPK